MTWNWSHWNHWSQNKFFKVNPEQNFGEQYGKLWTFECKTLHKSQEDYDVEFIKEIWTQLEEFKNGLKKCFHDYDVAAAN